MRHIEIGPDNLIMTRDVVAVAEGAKVRLSRTARQAVHRSRKVIDSLLREKKIVYGVTTGFGKFKDVYIDEKQSAELQRNLIVSHSVGVGAEMSREAVRASLFVRVNSLAKGYSGVREELVDTALALLNADICPVVPSQGSVGASGDLAPLAHMGLALMGEGEVFYKGRRMKSATALKIENIEPLQFAAKEGLAWTNGTSVMLGLLSLTLERAHRIADLSDIACALTLEAVRGAKDAFRPEIHRLRPHAGQIVSAGNILKLVRGSKLVNSVPGRIQDAYSIRCAPQVHGASRETVAFAQKVVDIELGSVTDNPLIFPDTGEALSGGNFHGEPLAQAADALSIALAEFASISERRTARLVDSSLNEGLPLFLIPSERAGLHSGLMMPHYTAAALVSENKVLAHPASVDSIPTSANQEDHVSMGNIAARKVEQIATNVENVLAIEFLTATQAIDFLEPKNLGHGTKTAYQEVRKKISYISEDRILHIDMKVLDELITNSEFIRTCMKSI